MAETIWKIESHTRAKHDLLRRYLAAWFPILTIQGFNRRVLYLDGFAGPGVYQGGEKGSPIIALETLVNHTVFEQLSDSEFVFFFIEKRKDRIQSLKREVRSFWYQREGGQPSNVKIYFYNDEFANVAEDIIEMSNEEGWKLAPTFAFIDPFGWSGVPMSLIRDLLSSDKCEVLFNFMFDSVNRFVGDERSGIAHHFTELFGTTEAQHLEALALSGGGRKIFLRNLYLKQLREVGGFSYVRSIEMLDSERRRTAYYLMFGTRHRKGLEVMKDAMWVIGKSSGTCFEGSAGDQPMLFDEEVDTTPLRNAILQRFLETTVSIEDVENFVLLETDYKTSHYKKQVLKLLEEEGLIVCESDRSRRFTYPPGTKLRFLPAEDTSSS